MLQTLQTQIPSWRWTRAISLTVGVGVAYFLAARLSLFLVSQPDGVAVFWPAAGISSGTLIALGRRARWPVAVGTAAATVLANLTGDRNLLSSLSFALCNAAEALLAAWLIERYFGSEFNLGKLRYVVGLLMAATVATATSGIGGTMTFHFLHSPDVPVFEIWQNWFLSDAIGIITVAPLLIGLASIRRMQLTRNELVEGGVAALVVAGAAIAIVFLLPNLWWDIDVVVVLLFPLVLFLAARCEPVFTAITVFIVSFVIVSAVTFKFGYFAYTSTTANEPVVTAQISIVGIALCAFTLAALFAERRQHDVMVTESETRLQDALAAGSITAFEWDATTDLVTRSDNAARILGIDPQLFCKGASFLARIHPDDCARLKELWSTLNRDNPTYSTSYRFLRPDGREIWFQDMSRAEFDDAGRLLRMKGVGRDITQRKRADEHQKVLLAELDHRVKNVLARVAVVAETTRQGSKSVDEFMESLKGRIQSMAAAHALLSQSGWQAIGLQTLVHTQLAPYTTNANTSVKGAEVKLNATAAQAIAFVLHELVTNAAKHGALSVPGGRVSVSWQQCESGSTNPMLHLDWREHGGPPLAPSIQPSYGTDLIRELIPHELGGQVDLRFEKDGVCCSIEVPIGLDEVEAATFADNDSIREPHTSSPAAVTR